MGYLQEPWLEVNLAVLTQSHMPPQKDPRPTTQLIGAIYTSIIFDSSDSRLEAIAIRMEAITTKVQAIACRWEAIAIRFLLILGWRPSPSRANLAGGVAQTKKRARTEGPRAKDRLRRSSISASCCSHYLIRSHSPRGIPSPSSCP